METYASLEDDFFPSTLEHRPLKVAEKMALKGYFEVSGADEYEGFMPSVYANCAELADLEAWVWGMRFWGRECIVRAADAATQMLAEAWDAALLRGEGDDVSAATAYSSLLTPAEAVSACHYWVDIPSEEKALRIMKLQKPLPETWFEEPQHTQLQGKPFFWGALAGAHLIQGILIKRDPAAILLAQACCGAARTRMLVGREAADAVADVRARMILGLRTWMGYKW